MFPLRGNFQIIAVHKALNKNEVPLKQKHVRVLIVGTHKEKSSSVFWNTISRIQLEKNPVLTWKFCHLLHKLIRDGHRKVLEESLRYTQRIVQLGNFWQHLHTSGYGLSNTSYCRMLVSRIEFHKRNATIPGSLQLTDTQLNTIVNADVNQSFELSIEMLDQMDDLLNLQTTVFNAMDVVRWSSLVPQGQCLLAPLILVILDTSKFYDYLVKIIFKLHEQLPPDALSGHRERFSGIFRKMKKFYEEAANLQYFKYLVSIPSLPSLAPNFLQASDLDTYQSPQAYLHGDNVSESDTPPDGRSIDESLVDVSEPQIVHQEEAHTAATDPRDMLIDTLRRDVDDARFNNERLMNEARSRIEQYENRLVQMKLENDHYKQSVDELKEELERVRAANAHSERQAVDEARLQDVERKAQSSEQNFQKMKSAYASLRQEHIEALTKLSNAQKDLATSEAERMNKEEEVRNLERKVIDAEQEKSLIEEKARGAACNVDDLQGQLAQRQVDIEILKKTIEELKGSSEKELKELKEKNEQLQVRIDETRREKQVVEERALTAANSADDFSSQLSAKLAEISALHGEIERMKESSARLSEEFNAKTADLETRLAESQKEKTAVEEKAKSAANNAEQLDAQLAAKLSEMAILNEVCTVECVRSGLIIGIGGDGSEDGADGSANRRLGRAKGDRRRESAREQQKCATTKPTAGAVQRASNGCDEGELILFDASANATSRPSFDGKQRNPNVKSVRHMVAVLRLRHMVCPHRIEVQLFVMQEATVISDYEFNELFVRTVSDVIAVGSQAYETEKQKSAKQLDELKAHAAAELRINQQRLFESCCCGVEQNLQRASDELHSANSISYPLQLALPAIRTQIDVIDKLGTIVRDEPSAELVHELTVLGHELADVIMCSAAAAYTVSIQHFEPVQEQCRVVAREALRAAKTLKDVKFSDARNEVFPTLKKSIQELETLCVNLPTSSGDLDAEKVGLLLEDEMKRMDEAIKKAVQVIEDLQKKSRATDSGIRLEVNEKILDSCNALMSAIIVLVSKSRAMQEEIVAAGRGTASPKEFYKRNHQWTEGLISAAKAVGVAATVLVQSADGAITGKGKLEHLIVASQEIGASTAQLFVSSRVKADRGSQKLAELLTASRAVNSCTASVVATVKSGQQKLSDNETLDFSRLSLHEAKKEEMESQVRMLELEAELTKERARFAQLRKQHYHLASLVANENGSASSRGINCANRAVFAA
uniref:I/LWEQ domain-containing protein n=1 Tax=Ascaris lumbricoides TaxID=6252 RepID=A0A9J2P354_ASCLU